MREPEGNPNKVQINICMGSACFARGNKKNLNRVKKFIQKNDLSHKIDIKGELCTGKCEKGPNARINGQYYHDLNQKKIIDLLKKHINENN